MKLEHIEIDNLSVSALNVRKNGEKNGDDLIPSLKSIGVIQPLLVRPARDGEGVSPTGSPRKGEGFEVIAGQRRLSALQQIAKDDAVDPVPCLIMNEDDDAKAIEASLVENIVRLPMDVIDQFEAFQALIKQGQSVEDIAEHFGVTTRLVQQRLAIANLYQPIRNAFRREEFNASTLQILTMATMRQQKEWYKLHKSEDDYAPQGYQLKTWLFGGEQIPVSNAIFDLEGFEGAIISDLFGDEAYFADPGLFWQHQNTAIAALIAQYKDDGWSDVILLERGEYWNAWDFVDTAKEEGGKVIIRVSHDGEVTPHEGQLSRAEVKKQDKAEADGDRKVERPELTKPMQNYLDLHRHDAVRAELLNHQEIALRLAVAQMIAGSELWTVYSDPKKAASEAIEESLKSNAAEDRISNKRKIVLELLGLKDSCDSLVYAKGEWGKFHDLHAVFARLRELSDADVLTVLTYIVAETLPCGSAMVEGLGTLLNVDLADDWKPDETFLDLLKDKEAINAMLKDIAGKKVADGNVTATAKAQKKIIQDTLNGSNGRQQNSSWQPRYMEFPMKAYTKRGGIDAITRHKAVKKHFAA